MTTEEFWEEMRKRKAEDRPMFAHATLKQPQTFKQWNGHGAEPEFTEYSLPTGACVIITMMSRFGDVGIRGTKTDTLIHGYDARVAPDVLSHMYFLPPLSERLRAMPVAERMSLLEQVPIDYGRSRS